MLIESFSFKQIMWQSECSLNNDLHYNLLPFSFLSEAFCNKHKWQQMATWKNTLSYKSVALYLSTGVNEIFFWGDIHGIAL